MHCTGVNTEISSGNYTVKGKNFQQVHIETQLLTVQNETEIPRPDLETKSEINNEVLTSPELMPPPLRRSTKTQRQLDLLICIVHYLE